MYSSFARLQTIGQLVFGYLILSQLELISFIKIDAIFEFLDYILDNFFKLCGFKIKEKDSLNNKLEILKEWIHKYLPDSIKIEQFKLLEIPVFRGFGLNIYISIQLWPFQVNIKLK